MKISVNEIKKFPGVDLSVDEFFKKIDMSLDKYFFQFALVARKDR